MRTTTTRSCTNDTQPGGNLRFPQPRKTSLWDRKMQQTTSLLCKRTRPPEGDAAFSSQPQREEWKPPSRSRRRRNDDGNPGEVAEPAAEKNTETGEAEDEYDDEEANFRDAGGPENNLAEIHDGPVRRRHLAPPSDWGTLRAQVPRAAATTDRASCCDNAQKALQQRGGVSKRSWRRRERQSSRTSCFEEER